MVENKGLLTFQMILQNIYVSRKTISDDYFDTQLISNIYYIYILYIYIVRDN